MAKKGPPTGRLIRRERCQQIEARNRIKRKTRRRAILEHYDERKAAEEQRKRRDEAEE